MPRAALTDLMVQKLKSDTQVTYYDTSLPSFGILIGKTKKTWLVMTGKERKRIVLGHYPALSLAEARRKAHEHLDTHQKPHILFSTALGDFRANYLPTIGERTAAEWDRLLTKHCVKIYNRYLHELIIKDVSYIFERLQHSPSTANHLYVAQRASISRPRTHILYNPLRVG